jgi:hypothetical protein
MSIDRGNGAQWSRIKGKFLELVDDGGEMIFPKSSPIAGRKMAASIRKQAKCERRASCSWTQFQKKS